MANDSFFASRTVAIATVALSGLFGQVAHAAGGAPAPATCNFSALVNEKDPAGLNVRASPSATAPVLGSLPAVWTDDSGIEVRVVLKVIGSSNGWFHIRDAFEDEALTGRPARPLYGGQGWISGRKLVVKSEASAGFVRPNANAPVAVKLKDDLKFDGNSTISAGHLVDCRGGWALVEFDEARLSEEMRPYIVVKPGARAGVQTGRFRAWLKEICGIQETSCDGAVSGSEQ